MASPAWTILALDRTVLAFTTETAVKVASLSYFKPVGERDSPVVIVEETLA